jgi:Mn2+/Fe2+ NRAMP family transporter
VPVFAVLIVVLLVFASYSVMTNVLKWLTLSLFAYVGAAYFAHPDWMAVLRGTFVPHVQFTEDALLTVVALLGTTISPYLFFWQAAQNAEAHEHVVNALWMRRRRSLSRELRDVQTDVTTGMTYSNGIMFFIILTAGATLHRAGLTNVQTAQQAAEALRPLAGRWASLLFTAGIVGTGLLGVPVLAGSAAYAVAEAFDWTRGMDAPPRSAPHFYGLIALATTLGLVFDFVGFDPIRLLFWSAVINGLLAPPLIAIILIVCNNRAIMKHYRNRWTLNILGVAAFLVMGAAAVALVLSWL